METWILFALLSAISTGLANFGVKIMVERNYDVYIYSLLGNALAFIYLIILLVIQGTFLEVLGNISMFIFLLAFINIFLLILSVNTRTISLQNIDTVIFYPIYKTLGPILVTLVSLFYFKETLTSIETIGIILGFLVPLMLITRKENCIQKNLLLGVIFIGITAVLTSVGMVLPKIIQVQNLDINSFLICAFGIGTVLAGGLILREKKAGKKIYEKGPFYFWVIFCSFHFLGMYFFTHALTGNLAIAFTINSFSILIPIILSIFFYGEHFNLKKGIVIALSIISILLFI